MNKIINSKTVFCNYHEISLSDSMLDDGLELSIRSIENPKEYVSVPLDKETIKNLTKMFKDAEFYEDVKNVSKYYIGCDPYSKLYTTHVVADCDLSKHEYIQLSSGLYTSGGSMTFKYLVGIDTLNEKSYIKTTLRIIDKEKIADNQWQYKFIKINPKDTGVIRIGDTVESYTIDEDAEYINKRSY